MQKFTFVVLSLLLLSCAQRVEVPSENSAKIVNGERVTVIGEYPASRSVVLLQRLKNGVATGFCTGVIISSHVGLSAGHCFDEGNLPGVTFNVIFNLSQWAGSDRTRTVRSFKVHPSFRIGEQVYNYDFGNGKIKSVTLKDRFDLTIFSFNGELPEGARPAAVYSEQVDLSNSPLYIYGAGHSEYLNGTTYSRAQFNSGEFGFLRRGKATIAANYAELPDLYFTTPQSEAKICRGDSGGPEFLASAPTPTVVGIHSAMIVNDLDGTNVDSVCGHTAVVTKVAASAAWIFEQQTLLESEFKN